MAITNDVNVRLAWHEWNKQQAQPAEIAPRFTDGETGFITFADAILEWRDPVNLQPDDTTIQAAWDAISAQQATADSTINTIKTTAQSTVGVALKDLSTAQIKNLLAVLLFNAGGVDLSTATIKPLNEWVNKE